jgi:hypothetical protein
MNHLSRVLVSNWSGLNCRGAAVAIGISLTFLCSPGANAAPAITSVEFTKSDTQIYETVRIFGTGFGKKDQAPPVLFDQTNNTWENGVANRHQSTFKDMTIVRRPNLDPNTIWSKPSLPNEQNTGIMVTNSRETRNGLPGSHYYGKGNDNYLGWPMASGGESIKYESETMFSAFWIKMPFDLTNYFAIPADQYPTSFFTGVSENYGEDLKVEGISGLGRVISVEKVGGLPNGWLFFEPPEGATLKELIGKRIIGVRSGAQVLFPESASLNKFDSHGFISPRGKYARFWSDPAGSGYRFSLANLGVAGTGKSLWTNNFGKRSPSPGKWNLFEVEIDLGATPRLNVWLNGELYLSSDEEWSTALNKSSTSSDTGLTIALLGINDFLPVPFSVEIDDIYLDKSLQRVMICNVNQFSEFRSGVGNCELQRIVNWSESEIEFAKYLGDIDSRDSLYLYVFDGDGGYNKSGVHLKGGVAAPSPINQIEIE